MGDISNGTRILLIQYLLKRLTDQEHALSREELISRISYISASVSGNTIKSDIESIKTFDSLINECHDILVQPYKCSRGGKIDYVTKQKKGSFVKTPFYSDVHLILLARLLKRIIHLEGQNDPKLIEKVLADSSIHRINHYHLLDDIDGKSDESSIFFSLQMIIEAINEYSCLDFKCLEYNVVNNEIIDTVNSQSILLYPTNIDIIDDMIYVVGYQFTKDEDIELKYYRIDRISDLKICYCPKNIQNKMESFRNEIWKSNDPLQIATKNNINLELRIYSSNSYILDKLKSRFKDNIVKVESFHQFVEISIKDVANDENLIEWLIRLSCNIEVLKPIELKDKIKNRIQRMQVVYRV